MTDYLLYSGLALMRRESLMTKFQEETIEAPEEPIQGAVDFHSFAEAAYTVFSELWVFFIVDSYNNFLTLTVYCLFGAGSFT